MGFFAFAFSLALGLGVAMLPVGSASAADPAPAIPAREVSTAAELLTTLAEASGWGIGREIRLTADIVVGSLSVLTGATVTIDLDGHSLLAQPAVSAEARVLTAYSPLAAPAPAPATLAAPAPLSVLPSPLSTSAAELATSAPQLTASAAQEVALHVQPDATVTLTGDGTLDARGRILIDGVFDNRSVVTASGPILIAGVVIDSGSLTPPVTAAPSDAADVTTALTRLVFHPNLAGFENDTIRLSAARQLSASGTTPVAAVLPATVQDAARSGFTFARAGHSLSWTTSPGAPAGDSGGADAGAGAGADNVSGAGAVWDAAAELGQDQNLFAQWTAHKHTVTFDSTGGSPVAPQTTDYGKTIGIPVDPVRAGFTFAGWTLAGVTGDSGTSIGSGTGISSATGIRSGTGIRWNPSTAITADVTLYASWTPLFAQPLADGSLVPSTDLIAVDRVGQRTNSTNETAAATDDAATATEAQASAAGSMPWMWIGLVVAGVVGMTMIPRGNDN